MPLRCLVVDDDPLARLVLERYIAAEDDLMLAGSCTTALEAAAVLRDVPIDLLFLDVEMPGMTGLELLGAIERLPDVVLVTANREYAADAFEAGVTDYLVKPLTPARFLKAVARVRARLGRAARPADRWIFVRQERALVRLDLADVRRVEAAGDFVVIHTGKRSIRVAATMQEMTTRLPAGLFLRVHRSHIVRLDLVTDFEDNTLVVGAEVIPVGESFRAALLKRIGAG